MVCRSLLDVPGVAPCRYEVTEDGRILYHATLVTEDHFLQGFL